MAKGEHWTLTTLRSRGWNDATIKHLLGEPDMLAPNPYYRSAGAPMKLWRRDRVLAAEESEVFKKRREQFEKRSEAGYLGSYTKTVKTLDVAKEMSASVTIPVLSQEELLTQAAEHYNAIQPERSDKRVGHLAPFNRSDAFRDRICVNFLRHSVTDYDLQLANLAGRVGKSRARLVLFEAVSDAIAKTYPELAIEARRQLEARKGQDLCR